LKISFHGADRGVTGSCHLIECAGSRVLVDCGLYQGGHEVEEENAEPFGFDPARIDALLLTHAHLDHCGRIPLLVKRGLRGEIVTTAASRDLARLVLLDSAHLQEEEAARRQRKGLRHLPGPLYGTLEALDSLDRFGRLAATGTPLEVAPGIRATFLDAGHILGSACILVELREGDRERRVLFSGDLGSSGRPILRDPTPPPVVDVVVMESTYGDRLHRDLDGSVRELHEAIRDTIGRGGNVIIPTFALERAQEILYFLREGSETGALPEGLQVFLDSPMAISATEIFGRHPECYDQDAAELFQQGRDPFALPGVHFTRQSAESMRINQIRSGAVVMAGSGMCTGGRVRHHLQHNLSRPQCSVIFVGFAARGTLAREIVDGAKQVRIYGEEVAVRARIHTINGFSAHADQAELLAWHRSTRANRTFLVHGEEEPMRVLARRLENTKVEMPSLHDEFEL
jgi:metallo-beta-lactamase family protein